MANSSEEEMDLRRGPWTLEEDTLLIHYIATNGEGRWNLLANSSGLKRTGKSCRLRWLNYLKPDIKRGNLTPKEQLSILELHSKWGNRWSKIAQHLPGRTDNEIKNYWRTRVQKQARKLNIDSNSDKFLEELRHFWVPRLLEKMEQNSPSPSSSSSSISSTSTAETQKNHSIFPKATQAFMTTQPSKKEKTLDWFNEKSFSNSEHQTSPTADQTHGNIPYKDSVPEDCYIVDISSFDMEGFNQDKSSVGSHSALTSDCQMVEADWISEDLGSSFWNMDELWQFRK